MVKGLNSGALPIGGLVRIREDSSFDGQCVNMDVMKQTKSVEHCLGSPLLSKLNLVPKDFLQR